MMSVVANKDPHQNAMQNDKCKKLLSGRFYHYPDCTSTFTLILNPPAHCLLLKTLISWNAIDAVILPSSSS